MLNLLWIRTLVTLLRCGSFQLTGQQLGLAQPTVTQHIQKLEEQLGVRLVTRGRGSCQPTPAARRLLPYAESLLRLNQRALEAVGGGQLRIGASSNIGIYLLPRHIQGFQADRGQGCIDMAIASNPQIASKLLQAEIDVALMEWWQPMEGYLCRTWRSEPLVLIVPPQHPLASLSAVSKEHLRGLALIGGEPGTGTGRILSRFFTGGDDLPRVSMQLGSTEAVKQAVRAGLGISLVLASCVEEEVRSGTLCAIPLLGDGLEKELMLVWREDMAEPQGEEFVRYMLATGGAGATAV